MARESIDGVPHVNQRYEIRRLLRYLGPYTPLLALGIFLISIMGMMDGLIALAIKPALDVVLNPHSTLQTLAEQHAQLLEAIEAGEGARASELFQDYFTGFYERLLGDDFIPTTPQHVPDESGLIN